MDNEKHKLEKELIAVDKKLEKEKTKRNFIMIILYSVLCGFILDTNESIFGLILESIILGSVLYFITMVAFVLVSGHFTDTTYLESRKKHLEEKLKANNSED